MNAILVLTLIAIGATSGYRKRAPAILARECCMFVLNLVLNRFRERQCFVECLLAHLCVRSVDALANLARQMYPGRGAFVQEAFADATASPYGYLLIDLKQNTPDDLRLRTSILPDDAHQFVYVLKLCRKV